MRAQGSARKPLPPVRVALFIEQTSNHTRGIAKGISLYARTHGPWHFFMGDPMSGGGRIAPPLENLREFKGDGIIAYTRNERMLKDLLRSGLPVVNTTRTSISPVTLPCIYSDDRAIGALAADYFLQRGFHHLAYCGYGSSIPWSVGRGDGFRSVLRSSGHGCSFHHFQAAGDRRRKFDINQELSNWIAGLDKPLALFCCSDGIGRIAAELCGRMNIRVPEEVAILGVDNDEMICEFSNPSLSSIALAKERVGFEAARMLAHIIHGGRRPRKALLVAPLGITSRRSTDVFAVEDAQVARALSFIHHHADQPIHVANVMKEVPLCRRYLEIRFHRATGRTLYEEIRRAHVERAKKLLVETDWPIERIAEKSGFTDSKHFYTNFRKETQQSPMQYRKHFKADNQPLAYALDATDREGVNIQLPDGTSGTTK